MSSAQIITEWVHRGLTIRLKEDPEADDPTESGFDLLARYAHWHRRYRVGGKQGIKVECCVKDWLKDHPPEKCIVLPLHLHDHSGQEFTIGKGPSPLDPAGWDSGQIGFVWCTWGEAHQQLGGQIGTQLLRDHAIKVMAFELADWNDWQAGRAAQYEVIGFDGEVVGQAGGFLPEGDDYRYTRKAAKTEADLYLGRVTEIPQPGDH